MLHYLDDLDSQDGGMRAHFEREATLHGPWTSYNPSTGADLSVNSAKFLGLKPRRNPVVACAPEPESNALRTSPGKKKEQGR